MSELSDRAEAYLEMRRALGHKLEDHGRLLFSFVDFLDDAGKDYITVDAAVAWASAPQGVQPIWWIQRLGVVRCFARHLRAIDERTEVPPADVFGPRTPRGAPYLYSAGEIASLMAEARRIRRPLKAATCETFIGLLASSGLRVGEAIGLDRSDVDLHAGLVTIRETKFRKSRLVPLHPSTITALSDHARRRDELVPHPQADSFFLSLAGTRLVHSEVDRSFQALLAAAGIERPGGRQPRLADLRHTFAVSAILGWYRSGVEVAPRLAVLSTYLGHLKPSSTYWYLQASPELLAAAAYRLEVRS